MKLLSEKQLTRKQFTQFLQSVEDCKVTVTSHTHHQGHEVDSKGVTSIIITNLYVFIGTDSLQHAIIAEHNTRTSVNTYRLSKTKRKLVTSPYLSSLRRKNK